MPHLTLVPSAEASSLINSKIEDLSRIIAINNQIIVDTTYEINIGLIDYLKRGKIDAPRYEEELKQNKEELRLREKAHHELEQQLFRMKHLEEAVPNETLCIIIESDIKKNELKRLIGLTKIKIALSEDLQEQLFSRTLLQTAVSCHTQLMEQRILNDHVIPILKKEKKYALSLLEEFKEAENNPAKSLAITDFMAQSEDSSLPGSQEALIDLELIKSPLTSISTGFKEFINMICNTMNKEPVFSFPEATKNPVQNFKEQLKLIKTETAQVEHPTFLP